MTGWFAVKADFDVRWCKGAVGERIIQPWAERLTHLGTNFRTGRRVRQISKAADGLPGRLALQDSLALRITSCTPQLATELLQVSDPDSDSQQEAVFGNGLEVQI